MSIGDRIKRAREKTGLTQSELGKICGVTKQTIFKYESGIITNIPMDKLELIAQGLKVPTTYLLGWEEVPPPLPTNLQVLKPMAKIPLVGKIACGAPILAEQNITDYIDLPGHIRADFALVCEGESMINAGIRDGDIVYIRQQEQVENGQIAAVLVGGDEATLKRVYYDGQVVQLVAENPAIPPKVYYGDAINDIHIMGLAVAYTHRLE